MAFARQVGLPKDVLLVVPLYWHFLVGGHAGAIGPSKARPIRGVRGGGKKGEDDDRQSESGRSIAHGNDILSIKGPTGAAIQDPSDNRMQRRNDANEKLGARSASMGVSKTLACAAGSNKGRAFARGFSI
jgi:hypothetical protein